VAAHNVPRNALFLCFGCLSNVGTLTGLAGLEVVKEVGPQNAAIFCLGGLATEVPTVLEKTRAAERIITVDGCPMDCARKIVEGAGFTPDQIINLVQDCGLQKEALLQHGDEELQVAVKTMREAVAIAG
jgi:uncharacterized metal-binding protein